MIITSLAAFIANPMAVAAVVAMLVTFLKPILEQRWSPTTPLHDDLVEMSAVAFGAFLVVTGTLCLGPITPASVYLALINGGSMGFTAIGLYHLIGRKAAAAIASYAGITTPIPTAQASPPRTNPLSVDLSGDFRVLDSAGTIVGQAPTTTTAVCPIMTGGVTFTASDTTVLPPFIGVPATPVVSTTPAEPQ